MLLFFIVFWLIVWLFLFHIWFSVFCYVVCSKFSCVPKQKAHISAFIYPSEIKINIRLINGNCRNLNFSCWSYYCLYFLLFCFVWFLHWFLYVVAFYFVHTCKQQFIRFRLFFKFVRTNFNLFPNNKNFN